MAFDEKLVLSSTSSFSETMVKLIVETKRKKC